MKNRLFGQTFTAIISLVLLLFCSAGYAQENIDPDNDDCQYAWGENVGWLNLEPGGDGGSGVEVSDFELTGYMWGENIGWIILDPTEGGVENDGDGNLSGYAWGENVGWINFLPTGGGVFIDACGDFNGTAWGENIGWINFRSEGDIPFYVRTSWVSPIDDIPPVTEPDAPFDEWYTSDIEIMLSATDYCGSGVVTYVYYTLDDGEEVGVSGDQATVSITTEGQHTLQYFSEDQDGNVEYVNEVAFGVDKTPPDITITSPPDGAIYQINEDLFADFIVADTLSGVDEATITAPVDSGVQIDTATPELYEFTVSAYDIAGNPASLSHTYTIATDEIPPDISITSPGDGATYQYQEVVLADYTVTDEGSEVASTDGPVDAGEPIDTSALGDHTFTVTAMDHAGNASAVTHTYTVVFNENIDPDDENSHFAWSENTGWINFKPASGMGVSVTDFAVTGYAWGENIGWINLGPAQGGVINDGSGNLSGYAWGENVGWINFSGVYIDACGDFNGMAWGENIGWINLRSDGEYPFKVRTSWTSPIDNIAPVTEPDTAIGGWYTADLSINLSTTDCGSGVSEVHYALDGGSTVITSGTGATVSVTAEGEHTLSYWSVDQDGNVETSHEVTFSIDKTPPAITITSPEDGAVYQIKNDLVAGFTVTDSGSQVDVPTITSSFDDGEEIPTTTPGVYDFTVSAYDIAGNFNSVSHAYIIAPDETPPEITIITPGDGDIYQINQAVLADFTVTDANSWVVDVTATANPGEYIDTSTAGDHEFSVTATDYVGNTTDPVIHHYTVVYPGNIDPNDENSHFAWGENVGWINLKPSFGPGVTVTDTGLSGYVWGENIGWINLSPLEYGGVVNDGCGNLSGYAWAENVGWISFSCENGDSCGTAEYRVTIDPATGEFTGRAWGENIGWITFRSTGPVAYGVTTSWRGSDADGDGIPDCQDNCPYVSNAGTDPNNADSDGDGYDDGHEIGDETDPLDSSSHAGIVSAERYALEALYNSTDGDEWTDRTSWLDNSVGHCEWYGVSCDASGQHVEGLELGANNLVGQIPSELGQLTELVYLDLFRNQLSGPIPAELGDLTNLQELNLGLNQLTGSIPSSLGNLTNLTSLALLFNQLSGNIPPDLGNLTNLTVLNLSRNPLSGTIPSELGNLTNLEYLSLSNNQLSGNVPIWLDNLTSLTTLHLGSNQLAGNIPVELGNLTNLQGLFLSGNQLSGPIPPELGNLTNLQQLSLAYNELSGPIPLELGDLTNLQHLSLGSNQLSGSIPASLGDLTNLSNALSLADNQLSGSIPASLGNLTKLGKLWLEGNMLTGEIPGTLASLTSLWNGWSDFRWNALYTTDPGLREFLDKKQRWPGDWESTQTVAPPNLMAGTSTTTSIPLSWTPITSTGDGYEVYYATVSGGPYTLYEIIADEAVSNTTVTGLTPGTDYYLVLRTVTNAHQYNKNIVYSDFSDEVFAATAIPDTDGDGILDPDDNCPTVFNPDQTDVNGDGYGDACVSPDVNIGKNCDIGDNPIIGAGCEINQGVSIGDDAQIGEYVIINQGSDIGDSVVVGDGTVINWNVTVGDNVLIGSYVTIGQNVTIGSGVRIGDNTFINRDVIIGNNVDIGAGVTIGRDAVIYDGAEIPDGTVIGKGAHVYP
jgi:Leucine-rich repeat (LRR) protein/acetyltransferase-like isoleucine patch superfamily enzyme